MRVYQLINHNGNAWANQFVISTKYGDILQSYSSLVCFVGDDGGRHISMGDDWDYSKTTLKAVCKFLSERVGDDIKTADIRKALEKGSYKNSEGREWTVSTGADCYFEGITERRE